MKKSNKKEIFYLVDYDVDGDVFWFKNDGYFEGNSLNPKPFFSYNEAWATANRLYEEGRTISEDLPLYYSTLEERINHFPAEMPPQSILFILED